MLVVIPTNDSVFSGFGRGSDWGWWGRMRQRGPDTPFASYFTFFAGINDLIIHLIVNRGLL